MLIRKHSSNSFSCSVCVVFVSGGPGPDPVWSCHTSCGMGITTEGYPLLNREIWGVWRSFCGGLHRAGLEPNGCVTSGEADQNLEQVQGGL